MPTLSEAWEVAPTRHVGDRKTATVETTLLRDGTVSAIALAAPDLDALWTLDVAHYVGIWPEYDQDGNLLNKPDLERIEVGRIISDPRSHQASLGLTLPEGVRPEHLSIGRGWVAPWKLMLGIARDEGDAKALALVDAMYPQRAEKPQWWDSRLKAAREGSKVENPWATPALDQSKTGTGAGSPLSVTYDSTPTSGDLLIAGAGSTYTYASPAHSISGWTKDKEQLEGTVSSQSAVLSKTSAGSEGAVSISQAGSSPSWMAGWISEWSGMAASSQLDVTASATSSSAANTSSGTTGTTAQNDEVCVAVITVAKILADTSWTAGLTNSFTSGHSYDPSDGCHVTGYRIVSSQAAYETSRTHTGSSYGAGVIATYKGAVAASTATRPRDYPTWRPAVHRASFR